MGTFSRQKVGHMSPAQEGDYDLYAFCPKIRKSAELQVRCVPNSYDSRPRSGISTDLL